MTDVLEKIHSDLNDLGIKKDDIVFVHSSYKSLGTIEGGAKTFIDALVSYFENDGTLVFPAFSFNEITTSNPVFSEKDTKSCVGYLSEYFRTEVKGVIRSKHATHSCCAIGKHAEYLVKDHYKDRCAVGENSPIYKLRDMGGKILFIGCPTDRNTAMHGVEHLYGKLPFCDPTDGDYIIETIEGEKIPQTLNRGAFQKDGYYYSQRYSRIENLLSPEEINKGKILEANCVVMLSKPVWEKGLKKLKENPYYFVEPTKL